MQSQLIKEIEKYNFQKNELMKLLNINCIPDIYTKYKNIKDLLNSVKKSKHILTLLKIEINTQNNIDGTIKYKNQYNSEDTIFWGIGIENECYLQGKPKLIYGKDIITMLGRERYSVNYTENYNIKNIKNVMTQIYKPDKQYKISQMINAQSFTKTDKNGEHITTYEKEPKPNPKFSGETIYELWTKHDPEIKDKINDKLKTETNIFFDGDTIEFITENFYKTTSKKIVNELNNTKKWFLDKFNDFASKQNLWNENETYTFVSKHPGLNIFKTMQNKIVLFNNSTIHIHITLPTMIKNCVITDINKFNIVHSKAIKVLQWFEPFFICTLGSPDIMQTIYENHYNKKGKYFSKGSMRATLSRYIGVGTYNPDKLENGKLLKGNIENVEPKNITWWRSRIKQDLLYNLPENEIGYDFNFSKHYQSGLEFRLLDGFPLEIMEDVLNVILLICEHSYNFIDLSEIELCSNTQIWNEIVYESMTEGYEAKINKKLMDKFIKILKINIFIKDEELYLEEFYYRILEQLFEQYKNTNTNVLQFLTTNFTKINRWINFNKIQNEEHLYSFQ
jgi:hypothetical protein